MNFGSFDHEAYVSARIALIALACLFASHSLNNVKAASQPIMLFDNDLASFHEINCDIVIQAEVMMIHANSDGKDSIVDCDVSKLAINGPVELHFKMKTEVLGDFGEYVAYWMTEGNSDWTRFERILFRPDGKWHRYRVPLADSGRMKAIRFTFGKHPHQIALADVQLAPLSSGKSQGVESEQPDLEPFVELATDDLSFRINSADHVYCIEDKRTHRTWQSEPISAWLTLVDIEKINDRALTVEMYDLFAQQAVKADIELTEDRAVKFSLDTASYDAPIAGASRYPPRFSTDLAAGQFVFCDRSCGVLLDQRDRTYAHWPLRVYGNTHCLDMPWVGLFDQNRRDGMMLLVETPADAEVAFVRHDDGLHWPEVRWLPSMDRFGYPRTATLRFSDHGGYVALANKYREFLGQQGRFRTLADKAKEKPSVARLRGAPALWGGQLSTEFIRQMRPLGIRRGIVNNCKDPGVVAWLNEQGYLTGCYDGYTDILEGATAFQRDSIPQTAIHSRPGGSPKLGWKLRSGQQMYWRSSALWSNAAASYLLDELRRIPYTARFIDVAAAAELLEDYHPNHTFDRRQDQANRRALYQRMNNLGLVLGAEHGNDWVVDLVEYFEGAMSGPFWWSSWPAGYLDRPRRDQFTENYLKFGIGFAHRVPLWELVYHDCASTTWYWGDTAGLVFEASPEFADRKDLMNILYGTTPLFWMDGRGYRLPEDLHRMLRSYHDTCPLHEVVAFERMQNHEFLSDDRAVQRTQFSNGAEIVVNFSDEPRSVHVASKEVVLAPRGFHVQGPGISQTRLWDDEAAQTVIKKLGYLTVDANGEKAVAGVKCNGRLTAFRMSDAQWNVFVTPGRQCELNVAKITGWDLTDDVRFCRMDKSGKAFGTAGETDVKGNVRFTSEEDDWRFAIVRSPRIGLN